VEIQTLEDLLDLVIVHHLLQVLQARVGVDLQETMSVVILNKEVVVQAIHPQVHQVDSQAHQVDLQAHQVDRQAHQVDTQLLDLGEEEPIHIPHQNQVAERALMLPLDREVQEPIHMLHQVLVVLTQIHSLPELQQVIRLTHMQLRVQVEVQTHTQVLHQEALLLHNKLQVVQLTHTQYPL
jgi:hypothetical protein